MSPHEYEKTIRRLEDIIAAKDTTIKEKDAVIKELRRDLKGVSDENKRLRGQKP